MLSHTLVWVFCSACVIFTPQGNVIHKCATPIMQQCCLLFVPNTTDARPTSHFVVLPLCANTSSKYPFAFERWFTYWLQSVVDWVFVLAETLVLSPRKVVVSTVKNYFSRIRYVSLNRTPINRNSRYIRHFPWEHSWSVFFEHYTCIQEIPDFRYTTHRTISDLHPV